MIPGFSRPKLSDFYTLSQTKLLKYHILHSGTYLHSSCMGVPLPGGLGYFSREFVVSPSRSRRFLLSVKLQFYNTRGKSQVCLKAILFLFVTAGCINVVSTGTCSNGKCSATSRFIVGENMADGYALVQTCV